MGDKVKYIINGKVWKDEAFHRLDLSIEDGKIKEISPSLNVGTDEPGVIDAEGLYVFPGFIDLHVHLREPGFSYKETIATGTEAAAAGGYTTVCTMPNLKPSPDSPEHLQEQLDIIKRDAIIKVLPFATITRTRLGKELVDYEALAPYVAGFSDDGSGVQDEEVMRRAMEGIAKTGKILAAHCEVDSLLDGGYIHKGKYAHDNGHKGISSESEWKEVERDINLCRETGCRLHICHVSTKESVDLIRKAKAEGLPVTCETGPHYLTFSDADLKEEGRFKMNPPLRGNDDREALRQGLIDGTIDVVATDHAPHSAEEKSKGLAKSAMGVVGLETAFAAVYTTMVASGLMPFERLVDAMSTRGAEILGLEDAGKIEIGKPASLALVDLDMFRRVDPSLFRSKGKATPYEGMILQGLVNATILNGEKIFEI